MCGRIQDNRYVWQHLYCWKYLLVWKSSSLCIHAYECVHCCFLDLWCKCYLTNKISLHFWHGLFLPNTTCYQWHNLPFSLFITYSIHQISHAFANQHIKRMKAICCEKLEEWIRSTLDSKPGTLLDMFNEMQQLSLRIVCKVTFEYDLLHGGRNEEEQRSRMEKKK